MTVKGNMYVYKIPKSKMHTYSKKYYNKHKKEILEKRRNFKLMRIRYYEQNRQFGTPIPYKFLTKADKELYEKPVKKRIFSIFGGGK